MGLPGVEISRARTDATPVVRYNMSGVTERADARTHNRDMSREIMEAGFMLERGLEKFSRSMDEIHRHKVARDTFDAVTKAKMAYQNSDLAKADAKSRKLSALSYYGLKGEMAMGASSKWYKAAMEDMKDRMKDMDPDTREAFLHQMTPFMEGMRENLFQYETKEVNRGRRENIAQNVTKLSDDLASGIATQAEARAEQDEADAAAREKMLVGAEGTDETAKAAVAADVQRQAEESSASRAAFVQGLIDQTQAQISMGASAIDTGVMGDPVYGQVYSPLEADAIKQGSAKAAYSGVVAGLMARGLFDEADAFVMALETGKGPDGKGLKRGLLAEMYGFGDDDITGLKTKIATARNTHAENVKKSVKAGCDQFDRAMDDNRDMSTWVGQLRGMAANAQVKAVDPERAAEYGRQADFLERCLQKGAKYEKLPTKERLTDDIEYKIARLKMLQNPNVYDENMTDDARASEITKLQNEISRDLRIGAASRLIDTKEYEKMHGNFKGVLTDFQNRAMAMFYSEFGLNVSRLNLDKGGALSKADEKTIEDLNEWYSMRGTENDDGGVGLRGKDFVRLSRAFYNSIQSLGETENREEVVRKTLNELKIRWVQEKNTDKRIDIMTEYMQDMRIKARE